MSLVFPAARKGVAWAVHAATRRGLWGGVSREYGLAVADAESVWVCTRHAYLTPRFLFSGRALIRTSSTAGATATTPWASGQVGPGAGAVWGAVTQIGTWSPGPYNINSQGNC